MDMQEIVAAIVDSVITTDVASIRALQSLGKTVRYVSRRDAKQLAAQEPSDCWRELALSKTLYLRQGSVLFRAV